MSTDMQFNSNPQNNPQNSPIANAPTSTDPTTATNQASAQKTTDGGAGSFDSSSTVSSLNDLKEKAPKVYKAMVMGIAQNICNEMQHSQERLKKTMKGET